MVMVDHNILFWKLLEDVVPDGSPNIEEFVVVGVVSITRQLDVCIRSHVVIHDRIKSPEMHLICLLFIEGIVCSKVTTVEVGGSNTWIRTTVLWHLSIELSDVPRVLNEEGCVAIHKDLRSIAKHPFVFVEVDFILL